MWPLNSRLHKLVQMVWQEADSAAFLTLFTGFFEVDIFVAVFRKSGPQEGKVGGKSKTRGDGSQPATQLINYSSWGEKTRRNLDLLS